MDVNITINVDGEKVDVKEDGEDIQIKKKRTKHGKESVLKMPYNDGTYDKPSRILDMLGA